MTFHKRNIIKKNRKIYTDLLNCSKEKNPFALGKYLRKKLVIQFVYPLIVHIYLTLTIEPTIDYGSWTINPQTKRVFRFYYRL